MEAGCPSSGVLSNIRRKTKARYKFAVRRIKRRKHFIIREKLAYSREHKNAREFWDVVNCNIKSKHSSPAPIVDGISGDKEIADLFALNLKNRLNIHIPEDVCSSVTSSITSDDASTISVSADDVFYAFQHLKRNKTDQFGVSSNHILYASSALIDPLASFFSAVFCHGYMPEVFRNCVVVPIPEGNILLNTTCRSDKDL